ncbi:MAG: hypothetical protein IJK98_09675, partial [Clostridia bacterium]|nr:hypothetical protein [Clostridia bacterium]
MSYENGKDSRGSGAPRPMRKDRSQRDGDPGRPAPRDDLVVGRNAVREALRAGRPADSLLVQKGERAGAVLPLIAECREKGIIVKEVDQ